MAITATPYGKALLGLGTGVFNLSSDTLKVSLHTSSYAPNLDTDQYFSHTSAEITGTGYTAGGVTLSSVTWTYDATNNWAVLAAANAVWSTATFTCRLAVVYKSTGTSSTSPLLGYVDYGSNQSPAAENFSIAWSSAVLRLRIV